MKLWEQLKLWKEECEWIDLSHQLSPNTPHWDGFPSLTYETIFDFDTTIFRVHKYEVVGQYGTHVDAPIHFVPEARTLDTFKPIDMAMPLCVIDKSEDAAKDADYTISIQDILDWEAVNGKIPEGAFVAFMTNWSKKPNQEAMENKDSEGNKHYPGWALDTLEFLIHERNIGAIGHETADTDSALGAATIGYVCETYILKNDRFQIELLKNLDLCPATGSVIFCTFPNVKDGAGFTARCFAVCPK